MYKENICFFLFFWGLCSNLFSQEQSVVTKFSQRGSLFSDVSQTHTLTEFKKNDECIVLDYLGEDIYKVSYFEWTGFVSAENLLVSDEMIDLVVAFEDKERIAAIKREEERRKRIQEIVRKSEEERNIKEQAIKDSIEVVEKAITIPQIREIDSVAKITQKIEVKENKGKDSIISLETSKQTPAKMPKRDSIAQEQTKKELEFQVKKKDSLLEKVDEENKFKQTVINDSIERLGQEKPQKIDLKKRDSIPVTIEKDSLTNIDDKIDRLPEPEAKSNKVPIAYEIIEPKTCNYVLNEYDEFYGIRIIRTEPYEISKKLTVELHRQGQSKNVFLNLSEDLGCASYFTHNRSYVKITLENDEVVTLYHTWDMDCGNFSFKSKLSDQKIENLMQSPIKSIWLQGTEGYHEITNVINKSFFIDYLKCIE